MTKPLQAKGNRGDLRDRRPRGWTGIADAWGMGFWLLSLLWLPVLVIGAVLIELFPSLGASPSEFELSVFHPWLTVVPMGEVQLWVRLVPMFVVALFVFSPAGLIVALPCRQLWRLGYRRTAWM